jgi:hypothetical protein
MVCPFLFRDDPLVLSRLLGDEKTPQQERLGAQWAGTVVCKRSAISPENLRGGGIFAMGLLFAFMDDAALAMIGLLLVLNS